MASKKKGKKKRRLIDSGKELTEAPGGVIEPGSALDEEESTKKAAVARRPDETARQEKKTEKSATKHEPKRKKPFAAFSKFLKDVSAEAKKVVWPDWEQLKNSTLVVVGTIAALSLFMAFFSNIFYQLSDRVFMPDVTLDASALPVAGESAPVEGGEGGGGEAGDGVPADAEGPS